MRLATRANGTPDGELIVVSADAARCLSAADIAPNLLAAIERWEAVEPMLLARADLVAAGQGEPLDPALLRAPLPRSWQWLDGSAFATHGELMQVAFGLDPIDSERPLMYQGLSDRFLGPHDDVPVPDAALGIDFEGEFGVIVDAVPMGTSAAEAARHIRLLVQINDWSLRAIAPIEMKTGFGWVQAKPACAVAPFACTPDELGGEWRDGRVCCDLAIDWNGARFGRPNGAAMAFSFPELVAHAARTRDLVAGTIIGSGTVSNPDYATVGSACISERRAIEIIAEGNPRTPFMSFGDRVRMEAVTQQGATPFGVIEQTVVAA
ncbi:fumarylacetoacetate hydrolase family protein [Novosphingobium piscinae]|uniref:Fumarylacetoacetate hydrolase family protein n=1 Tax=Novosphingobium piscinae TaxID=1507448 RepID=A0A7X1KPK7_9SPHN|nr:fumarylacetoacetate hydrolase family protein [Novosphingobium piscinae]MBC2668832.1 fumarylacetoacetate hydrolase family protein [Novosphingobium piscinae]